MPRPSPLNESTDAMSLDGLLDSVSCGSFSSPPSPANYLSEYWWNSWNFTTQIVLHEAKTIDKEVRKKIHFINWRSRFFIISADADYFVYGKIRESSIHQREYCFFFIVKNIRRHWYTIYTWRKGSLNGWTKTQRSQRFRRSNTETDFPSFCSIFTYAKAKPIPNSRFTITHKSNGFTLGAESCKFDKSRWKAHMRYNSIQTVVVYTLVAFALTHQPCRTHFRMAFKWRKDGKSNDGIFDGGTYTEITDLDTIFFIC